MSRFRSLRHAVATYEAATGRSPSSISFGRTFTASFASGTVRSGSAFRSFETGSKWTSPASPALGHGTIRDTISRHIKATSLGITRPYHSTRHLRRHIPAIGAEPGIDDNYRAPESVGQATSDESIIRVIDYSDQHFQQHEVSSSSLNDFLNQNQRPEWAACRWIYINALSLDVVRRLGNSKGLHPLAVEDVMDPSTPTKVDWYDDHCFMELNMAKLVKLEARSKMFPRHNGPTTPATDRYGSQARPKWRTLLPGRFGMSIEQVSMFLTSDNTVITIFENSGDDILNPILARLKSTKTVIRSSNDPSMLVQAVIDAVVDTALPIGRAVGEAFDDLEYAVLTSPQMEQSKQLHTLRSGLTLLAEHTISLSGLIRSISDHRAVADLPKSTVEGTSKNAIPAQLSTSVQISPLTQVYLHDVQDHVTALSDSTRMSIRSAENLTALIFNTITASQNESVRKLTLVSSFFLPLTFLTGYMGMNFETMPVVNEHSDAYFWLIATPVMLTTLILLVPRGTWSEPFRRFRRWRTRRNSAG
ncbi:Cobalt/magnesium transport protein CorA [Fulvia fulva]|uniref:Cobalt/magnesium transport protein CorA n=1 Tax=Passalora fulva TaxID=5499 RepID=A0A9Q8P8E8_PASFU|nr:Cobalt/magnesium transport protein CorA [Fulvia fulva]KAK4626362.1 Cobalt/magnesium transport protein CorA [Fulvia fulva]KAK4628608.1 Cobalt/magnesium transport protein CorA [Fulvia fulva]UJO17068.1 Cobalt/magnesium transport protein CorA [Fulvia fulva]WPV13864.1 Cobalt/magnesium transport protein CorA [Fulvia fulva]WPV29021.1 Cobalt/magnesium transport protein CorA [Fulvia fulva]